MLYDYLTSHYNINEPIFLSDIVLPNVTNNYLRQMFKQLCDSGKLCRFNTGIYYFSSADVPLSAAVVAERKYICHNSDIFGYYIGQTFANQIGLLPVSTNTLEIVTNHTSGKYREIQLDNTKIILRKPKFPINNDNYKVLQLLDFLKDIESYTAYKNSSCIDIVKKHITTNQITKASITPYITSYPDKIYRIIYEMDLYEALYTPDNNVSIPLLHPENPSASITPKRRRELSVELL